MAMRIWHQSFTVLAKLAPYRAALEAHIRKVCRPDTEVVLHGMHPDTYRTAYPGIDIRYAVLQHLHSSQFILGGLEAERQGFDAYAICTIPDVGLKESRSILNIPAVGYGEAAMLLACTYGERFGILNFIPEISEQLAGNARRIGLGSRLAGVRHVGFTFDDVVVGFDSPASVIARFQESARAMIRDGADVIIPGEAPLGVLLAQNGINRVDDAPIVDGLAATMKMAELQVDLRRSIGIEPSRDGYYTAQPPRDRVEELVHFYGLDSVAQAFRD
jgi:allantoin racemase